MEKHKGQILSQLEGHALKYKVLLCACKKRIFHQIWMVDVSRIINRTNKKYESMVFHIDGF